MLTATNLLNVNTACLGDRKTDSNLELHEYIQSLEGHTHTHMAI